MDWFKSHLLSVTVFLPLLWALLVLFVPRSFVKAFSLFGTLVVFGCSLVLAIAYAPVGPEFQFVEKVFSYGIGIDGISLALILLTTFLVPLALLSSFSTVEHRLREYYGLLLALETGMLGAFVATDVFLFYLFWEAMLIPMYLMIGIWGGAARIRAATKFFIYTAVGSLFMLVAIFVLAAQHQAQFGIYSTALTDLYRVHFPFAGPFSTQGLLFLAFAFAFAIKVPLFPFHTWLPDAHVEAPTAGSVILAGVLLKFGGYGFIRFAFPFFPEAVRYFQEPVMLLASIAIIYGAMMALVQTDVKKLVAYSSVSHMGYVMLGLFSLNATAVSGALYQMLSHGVSTGALFILVGMIYERRHTREVSAFGGLAKSMPRYALAFVLIGFSAIGLPGLNGFVGEFLILLGSWQAHRVVVAIAVLGVLFGAIYVLWLLQRMFFGSIDKAENENPGDLCLREWFVILPFLFAVIAMGIVPNVFFQRTDSAVQRVLSKVISERGD